MDNSYRIRPERSADGRIINLFSVSPDSPSERSLYNDRDTQRYKMYKEYFEKNPSKQNAKVSEIELAMGSSSYKVSSGPDLVEMMPVIDKTKETPYPVSEDKASKTTVTDSLGAAGGIIGSIIYDVTVKPVKNSISEDNTYGRPPDPKPIEVYGSSADEKSPLGTSTTDPRNFDYSKEATILVGNVNRWYKEETSDGVKYWVSEYIGRNADDKPVYIYRLAKSQHLLEHIKRLAGDYEDSHVTYTDIDDVDIPLDEDLDSNVLRPSSDQDDYIRSKSVKYKGLYNKYYSASDFRIYIGDILLDKASGVIINESLSSLPIYTIGNSRYDFLSRGNIIVSGFISINKSDRDYIARVLSNYSEKGSMQFKTLSPYEQMQLTTEELAAYKKKENQYSASQVSAKSVLDWADLEPFTINLVYNNADVITAGEDHRVSIIECRIVGYEHGVDISSDGQLIDGYKFIAKEVVPE